MNIKVIRPNIDDFIEIHNLFKVTIGNNFHQEKIQDPTGTLKESVVNGLVKTLKDDFESNGKNEYHLVAKNQDTIIGIIAFGKPNQIIIDNLKLKSSNTPELKSVYVLPTFQNCGVGNLLLKNILNSLKEKGCIDFCLDSGYINAQRFWRKKLGPPIKTLDKYWTPKNHHMIWYVKIDNLIV